MYKFIKNYDIFLSRYSILLAIIILALAIIGISAAIISIYFGRPIGDDYGAISTYHLKGDWLNAAYESLVTTGRYSQSIMASSLYGFLGNRIVTLLPFITLIWFIGLLFVYVKFFLKRTIKHPVELYLYSASAAIVLTFLILVINNNPPTTTLSAWIGFQLFLWPSGIITYTLPLLILFTSLYLIFISDAIKGVSEKTKLIIFGAIVLFTSLFNEVQPAVFGITCIGLLGLSRFITYKPLRKYRAVLSTITTASFIGLVAMYFSPGRFTRTQFLDSIEPAADGSLVESVMRNIFTLVREVYFRPREIILLTTIGFVVSIIFYFMKKNRKSYVAKIKKTLPYIILIPLVCALSVIISITLVVMGYGYTAGIYPRTMLLSQITYVTSILLLSFTVLTVLLERYKNKLYLASIALICVSLLFLAFMPNYVGKIFVQVNSSVTYANLWDKQDAILKEAASNNIKETVYLETPATGIGDGFSLTCTGQYAKSTMWLNVQIWEYYGSKEERICEKPTTKDPIK